MVLDARAMGELVTTINNVLSRSKLTAGGGISLTIGTDGTVTISVSDPFVPVGDIDMGSNDLIFGSLDQVEIDYSDSDTQLRISADPNVSAIPGFVAVPLSDPGFSSIFLYSDVAHTKAIYIRSDGTADISDIGSTNANGLKVCGATEKLGFYNATPVSKQTGVAVTAAAIHAALVNLGLIAA